MRPRRALIATILVMVLGVSAMMLGCAEDAPPEKVALTFLEFFDPNCPFCAEMEPAVEKLEREYAESLESFEIVDVTTDEGRQRVEDYGIFLTPTFVLLDADGEELDRISGACSEETLFAFMERGIADVKGEPVGPREPVEGEGSAIEEE